MGSDAESEGPTSLSKGKWLRQRIFPILTLSLVIAIIVGVFYFYQKYPEKIEALEEYGYLGAFLISIVLNATIVLPMGAFAAVFTLGAILPFFPLVGLAAGLGAAIGEMTGYMAGSSGRAIIRRQTLYKRLEEWLKKWGAMTIFAFSVAPLFFDIAGIAAGTLRFPAWKFFVACWLGRTLLYLIIAWAGHVGWDALRNFLGG